MLKLNRSHEKGGRSFCAGGCENGTGVSEFVDGQGTGRGFVTDISATIVAEGIRNGKLSLFHIIDGIETTSIFDCDGFIERKNMRNKYLSIITSMSLLALTGCTT